MHNLYEKNSDDNYQVQTKKIERDFMFISRKTQHCQDVSSSYFDL